MAMAYLQHPQSQEVIMGTSGIRGEWGYQRSVTEMVSQFRIDKELE
jgi:hypothetical protein